MSGREHVELVERGQAIRVGQRERRRITPEVNSGGQVLVSRGEVKTVLEIDVERPQLVTLALTRVDRPTTPGDELSQTVSAPLVARIGWGGGRAVEPLVYCDWCNGLSLTVPVSAGGHVRVDCDYPAVAGFATDLPQLVGAVAGYGQRPPASGLIPQARYTVYFTLNAGDTELLTCPPRATAVRLLTNRPNAYGAFQVDALAQISKIPPAQFSMLPVGPEELPLGAGTRAVLVANNAALATRFAAQWTIAL